jgi:hypothetical protein
MAVASVHGHPQGEILQAVHSHGVAEYFHLGLTRNVELVNWVTLEITDSKYRACP